MFSVMWLSKQAKYISNQVDSVIYLFIYFDQICLSFGFGTSSATASQNGDL